MKIRSLHLASAALCVGAALAHAAPPVAVNRPVLWSVHFDAERLRAGAGQELFASLDPVLTALSGENASVPGGKLESVVLLGFPPQKGSGEPFPFVADIRFSSEAGGISRRFEAISKKRDLPIENVAGSPTIHFQHEGKAVWIAKPTDDRLLLTPSRTLLEIALTPGASAAAPISPADPAEMLGGHVEIEPLLAANPELRDSQLLKLVPHVEFHLLSESNGQLDLNASAKMDDERAARRAARMIDGMVAALAMRDANGVPWDERINLKQNGGQLALQLHLEPQEARKLFDGFAREIRKGVKAAKDDE